MGRALLVVRPAIGIDRYAVVAVPGGAMDQQPPDLMLADIAERSRWPSVALGSSSSRRVVVGVAVVHLAVRLFCGVMVHQPTSRFTAGRSTA
jgi:hypothetical protein